MALDHLRLGGPVHIDPIERVEDEITLIARRPVAGDDRVEYAEICDGNKNQLAGLLRSPDPRRCKRGNTRAGGFKQLPSAHCGLPLLVIVCYVDSRQAHCRSRSASLFPSGPFVRHRSKVLRPASARRRAGRSEGLLPTWCRGHLQGAETERECGGVDAGKCELGHTQFEFSGAGSADERRMRRALGDRDKRPFGGAGIELTRAKAPGLGIRDHLVPLRDPTRRGADLLGLRGDAASSGARIVSGTDDHSRAGDDVPDRPASRG